MGDQNEFRKVNQILGASPKIGPIPSELAVPWILISLSLFFISYGFFQLPWISVALIVAWGDVTWWILVGSRPHKFLSKFIGVPSWTRGVYRYEGIKGSQPKQNKKVNAKAKKRKRV
jgi:hypothetical protein